MGGGGGGGGGLIISVYNEWIILKAKKERDFIILFFTFLYIIDGHFVAEFVCSVYLLMPSTCVMIYTALVLKLCDPCPRSELYV